MRLIPKRHTLYCCSQLYLYCRMLYLLLECRYIFEQLLLCVSFTLLNSSVTQPGERSRTVRSSNPGRNMRFFSSTSSRSAVGATRPPTERTCVLAGVKRTGRDAHHSPPNCVEVKECSYHYNTFIYLHSFCRDNFTFLLPLPLPSSTHNIEMFKLTIYLL